MATDTSDEDFLQSTSIAYLIPSHTNFNTEKKVRQAAEAHKPFTEAVDQRTSLFFDETVDVYILLRARHTNEKTLRSYLPRLSLGLEAQVICTQLPERDGPPPSEVIYQGVPDGLEDPYIFVYPVDDEDEEDKDNESGEQDEEGDDEEVDANSRTKDCICAVWKLGVFMARPRIRLQNPSAVFCVSAELQPPMETVTTRDGYLPSGQAAGMNLLESFSNDPALGGIRPRLSALRVSRVAPLTGERNEVMPIRTQKNRSLRIYPAVHTRVRFARPNTTPPSPAIVALLEVDFTPYFDCEIALEKITLSVADGIVEDLNDDCDMMALPLSCVAHDHVTFLYRLTPTDLESSSKQLMKDLQINIDATALVWPKVCYPKLSMSWTTALDFTMPVNPSFGTAAPAIQRSHRPGQLSISGGGDISSMKSPSVTRPDAIPTLEAAARSEAAAATAPPDIGIAVTLTGPKKPVHIGDVFVWDVFVVNHTPIQPGPGTATNQAPRKLTMSAIPKRRRTEVRVTRPPSMTAPSGKFGKKDVLADAVLDENVVHAMQRGSLVDAPEVVCLSADTRVGPLAPGACHVAELRFLALKDGIVGVEALRVIDLVSNEHVDVYDLPITVVQKKNI
ncbi:hypothetical protein MKZ38_007104 [Zalerion maritima]|uniref:Trafficking protein particle complex II-specific subunit 65 IgD3 domain-containing protein n=1 Tax=Zalerion maritima TaxID=339359 RepID=A0AAD5WPE5_9PEZI|nr:hypothetical protein MKZ38_007104 [Zalerion maritima]